MEEQDEKGTGTQRGDAENGTGKGDRALGPGEGKGSSNPVSHEPLNSHMTLIFNIRPVHIGGWCASLSQKTCLH